ncbi:MAG: ferrous iron transport protein A [Blastocatellia bacterium]|nr:ferrous iron transport protein A [Blastocatellia bacterium]
MLHTLLSSFRSRRTNLDIPQKLAEVPTGCRVRICKLSEVEGVEMLRERGLCEDAEVRVLSAGDPLVCLVWGSRVMLNRTTAESITVEVLS